MIPEPKKNRNKVKDHLKMQIKIKVDTNIKIYKRAPEKVFQKPEGMRQKKYSTEIREAEIIT